MTVLDISNYDDATFDAVCFKASGVTGVILGCQNPVIAERQAAGLRAAGMPILGVYGFDYFGTPGDTGDITDAIRIAQRYGVQRVWIDAEVDAYGGVDPIERNAEVAECVRQVEEAGLSAGIYTGQWWWYPRHANSAEFSHLPLWHSAYRDYNGTPYEVRTVNYGGWRDVAVHQWTSTYDVCGRKRDANHVWESQEDELSQDDRARIDRLERLLVKNGIQLEEREERVTGEEALLLADERGWSAFLGIGLARTDIAGHISNHPPGLAPGTKFLAEVVEE